MTDEPSPERRWWMMAPDSWRGDLLRIVLRVLVVLGGIVCVPSVALALQQGIPAVAVVDSLALGTLVAMAFAKRVPHLVRAAVSCLVMYVVGAALMVFIGSIAQIYLFAFSLLAALLMGVRWGLASAVLNTVTMLAVGFAHMASPEMAAMGQAWSPAGWLVITANFTFVNVTLVLALGAVVRVLESAVARANSARGVVERERKELLKANEALTVNRALLRIAGTVARIGGWRIDLRDQSLEWSEEVRELHEAAPGFLPSIDDAARFYPEPFRQTMVEAFARCAADGAAFDVEVQLQTAKGNMVWVRAIGHALRDLAGTITHVHGSLQDISREKAVEAQHEKLEVQLRQAQKMDAVGRLAGGVAHDFNNMLSVILGNAHLTLSALAEGDERRNEVQEIIDAANRSAELTNRLLAFARKQTIAPRVLELNDTIGNMLKILGRLIGEDIELVWKPGRGLQRVKIDATQLDQVLANLVVNARDAIVGVGRLVIETQNVGVDAAFCELHTDAKPGEYVQISVTDSGSGMDKATQAKLFEPFFTTKAVGKGTGLGLATVYGIVQQNGGFITVYSEVGQGSTFRIHLPRAPEGARISGELPKIPELPRGTETVLLVEDEAALLRLGRRSLESLGYTVLATDDPRQALALAAAHGEVQLLVTDVIMPRMSGREVWEALKAKRPGLKCLFISGYTADVISNRGVLEEGVHFLQKPFTMEQIAVKVREALAG